MATCCDAVVVVGSVRYVIVVFSGSCPALITLIGKKQWIVFLCFSLVCGLCIVYYGLFSLPLGFSWCHWWAMFCDCGFYSINLLKLHVRYTKVHPSISEKALTGSASPLWIDCL